MPGEYLIGMMSGTSADGVDAIIVEFTEGGQIRTLDAEFTPYSERLQTKINKVAHSNLAQRDDLEVVSLDKHLAEVYASAAKALVAKSGIDLNQIAALANHGQTVAHRPNEQYPESLQIGDPQLIANLLGLRVISQFRQADLTAGGQGAPLMPAFHKVLLELGSQNPEQDSTKSNAYVVNLGGIANISAIPGSNDDNLIGFDTGPANTLLNQWIKRHKNKNFDHNGDWARSGATNLDLLNQLLREPYFAQSYPKSTGPDFFNLEWLSKLGGDLSRYRPEDVQATLLALTIQTIGSGLKLVGAESGTVYVCGGGASNVALMQGLDDHLTSFKVLSTQSIGVAPDWMEAAGFAWLGHCYLHGVPSNYPSVTGASKKVVLGKEFLPNSN